MPVDDPEYFREVETDIKKCTIEDIDRFEQDKGIVQTDPDDTELSES